MNRYLHSSSNFHNHIPSELDFLIRVKIIADIAPARKRRTRARTNRRYFEQWRRSRNVMLKSPSSTSSTLSSATGFLRFLNIFENLVDAMQRNSLRQCSGGCYKWQEGKEFPLVWARAILYNTRFLIALASLSSGIYIEIGVMFPWAEETVNQTVQIEIINVQSVPRTSVHAWPLG